MKSCLTFVIVLVMVFSLAVPAMSADNNVIYFNALRTANNPGYYFSGALIDMGVMLTAGSVDKDTFYAKARITEYDGSVQGTFGNFAWDPQKSSYALGDGWARWNILDAYVSDADGNKVNSGRFVKIDIEYETRTEPSGASSANRYDVPATRAAWYTAGSYIAYANIQLDISQNKAIPGIAAATYVQGETKHDPLFDKFTIADAPGGGQYSLYTPANASQDNKRPILVWFHGTGERYHGANPGGNLIGNRVLAFADEEFQTALGGCYVLAPQSTTAGWSTNRLNDMESLIKSVVAENNVDPTRIYIGGLSMGTWMTGPMIASTTAGEIPYAAAILCSGGNIDKAQAQIIADKGISVYFVGSTSDGAANTQPSSLANLLAAGCDAKMKRYPAGPVFDGKNYFGAHDAWNYIYNNMVADENGETIFEWLAKQSTIKPLDVTTNANLVKKGDYFDVAVSFHKATTANAVSFVLNYDSDKFEYAGNLGADSSQDSYIEGVTYLTSSAGEGKVKLTMMIPDYKAKDLASLRFRAKENADIQNADNSITASADYVYKNSTGIKTVRTAFGSTDFTSSGNPGDTDADGKVTLLDLSNVIDMFGVKSGDALWTKAKFFDFNNNKVIDIADIVAVAKLIL